MGTHSWWQSVGAGVATPIVLGPFGGVSSVALTAAVSNLGGLGSYGLYGYDAERITHTASALRAATDRPFALNLWVPTGDEVTPDEVSDADWNAALSAYAPLFAAVDAPLPAKPARFLPPFQEQWEAVIAARPAVISTVFGIPERIDEAHAAGAKVVGTATTVAEAVALADAGVDAIVASGLEAGGHRVSFLADAETSLIGNLALVPAVVAAVDIPVIAAGGIAHRAGVRAARELGASGVQVGSAFLAVAESAAPASHRALARQATSTVLTRAMSGRLSRGIQNTAVRHIEQSGVQLPFPAQNWLTGRFRAAAAAANNPELLSLWAGQATGLATGATAEEVFLELCAGLESPK